MSSQEYDDLAPIGDGSLHEDPTAGRRTMSKRLLDRDHTEDDGTGMQVSTTPGTKWFYGSGNYIILGAVIEQLTGLTFQTAMQNMIFNPLFITTAAWGVPAEVGPAQPHGHRREEAFPHNVVRDNFSGRWVWNPAGGLNLSQADWLKFCRVHIYGSEGLLSLDAGTLVELHTPHPLQFPGQPYDEDNPDPSYGWGWGIGDDGTGEALLSHDGTYGIFYSRHTVHVGHQFAVVSAVNIGPGRGFGDKAVHQLHTHLIEKCTEKTTGSGTTFGRPESPSGGDTSTIVIQRASDDGSHEHRDQTPINTANDFEFQLAEGYPFAPMAQNDAFNQILAAYYRKPNVVSFAPHSFIPGEFTLIFFQ